MGALRAPGSGPVGGPGWSWRLLAGATFGLAAAGVAGRLVRRWLADNFPLVYVAPLALLALLLVVPTAILLAKLLAAVPARSAARIRPAEASRKE